MAAMCLGLIAIGLIASTNAQAQLPVFPGAVGFGSETVAGRGGEIVRVTNLNDSGPGSLRAAIDRSGRRTIVFEVGGIIWLDSQLEVRDPFVTIAGQTAPRPGITLAGDGLKVKTHDVLVQHLRIRPGDRSQGTPKEVRDAGAATGSQDGSLAIYNVVFDHCSMSWATDENFSTWYRNVRDITLSHSIVSEALRNAGHPKGPHSMGYLVGDFTQNAAVIGNLFAHNENRNPLMKGATSTYIANNIMYNYVSQPIAAGDGDGNGPSSMSIIGNQIMPGLSTTIGFGFRVNRDLSEGSRIFLADNRFPGQTSDPWSIALVSVAFDVKSNTPPIQAPERFTPLPVGEVNASVLTYAGATPAFRDSVDARVIADVRAGTGRVIDSQNDVGGWPDHPLTRRSLPLPSNPNADDDGDGYTNLEHLLHRYAAQVEGRNTEPVTSRISIADLVVDETDGTVEVTVSLDRPTDRDFTALVYTQPRSANNGTDFYGLAKMLQFRAGTQSQTVAVQILDNSDPEPTEFFTMSLHLKDVEFVNIAKRVAAVTIRDNDS